MSCEKKIQNLLPTFIIVNAQNSAMENNVMMEIPLLIIPSKLIVECDEFFHFH